MDYESWRPALIAFYKKDGCLQMAENLEKFGFPLTIYDKRVIDALAAAYARLPVAA